MSAFAASRSFNTPASTTPPGPMPAPASAPMLRAASSVSGPASQNAPSIALPMRFMIFGLLSLFTGAGFLVARPDVLANYHYGSQILAITHIFTLGFIASIVMGAMYQLVPVALEARLFSERLGRWQFVMHALGVAGMVWTFWIFDMKQVGHWGSLAGLGIGLFVYNIARTLKRIPRWNVIAWAIASALFWISFAMLAGLYLTAAKCWSFSPFQPMAQMHAHAHAAFIGFFLMMIVGVSYKLVPMFTLSDVQSTRRAAWSIGLLNAGLAGLFVTVLLQSALKPVFAAVVTGGLVVYGWEMRAILQARLRRELDWGIKAFLLALSLLAPVAGLGLFLSWPGVALTDFTGQMENLYGFLALLGVVTLAILGMLFKIMPFLVWYAVYSRQIGRCKVPSLADLYSARLQVASFGSYLAALIVTGAGIVMMNEKMCLAGAVLLAASLLLFAANMAKILSHLFRPCLQPLVLKPHPKPSA